MGTTQDTSIMVMAIRLLASPSFLHLGVDIRGGLLLLEKSVAWDESPIGWGSQWQRSEGPRAPESGVYLFSFALVPAPNKSTECP